ncbi:PP2C-domain-containing protein [Hanseniaspora valbyensis NRRL Y-1626]|uniref:Adenylate cyclase n=1 Tax=Hanseniaspora valbyensis NRRL Y-1626 TaxID=766949 RepID=A0A1B7TCW2_9ASCO|nr:PP2C-domain-containing protein [Hanseniaspora valbyensis NRRL Y-1626]
MSSKNNQANQSQQMTPTPSQGSSAGSRFRKSLTSRHFSTTSNNDLPINDDNLATNNFSGENAARKKSSGISLFKKKFSNAAHSSHHHNPLHNNTNENINENINETQNSARMNRHFSEALVNKNKNDLFFGTQPLYTIFSNQQNDSDTKSFQEGKDESGKTDQEVSNSINNNNVPQSQPISRTFSTPSFFSSKFKKNSKDHTGNNMDQISPVKSDTIFVAFNNKYNTSSQLESNDPLSKSRNSSTASKPSINKTNSSSSGIITGLDKLSDFNKNNLETFASPVAPIFSNEVFTAPDNISNSHFSIDDNIREPSNLEIPSTNFDSKFVWKAPESWDVFNADKAKSSYTSKNDNAKISSTSSNEKTTALLPSHFDEDDNEDPKGNQIEKYISNKSNPANSKKNSLGSINSSSSMSPLSKSLRKRSSVNPSPLSPLDSSNLIVEERDDSYDSDNDDIILTTKSLEKKQQLITPTLKNDIFSSKNSTSDKTISNTNNSNKGSDFTSHSNNTLGQLELNNLKRDFDPSSNSFKQHFNSVGTITTRAGSDVENSSTTPADLKERPSVGVTPFKYDDNSNEVLTDSSIQSYELYYNDFSTFDMNRKYVIKIFNSETNTFTTLSCVLNTTVAEMLPLLKKKFNCSPLGNFQISLKIGKLSKVLHMKSKPVSIQLRLLLLTGYRKTHDPLNILGIEDLSFVFQFLFHPILTSQLSIDKEELILKRGDFIHADLRDLDLSRPPIIFYQKASEIESLDLSSNANSFLPLDFIESAISLSSIRMVNLRASKFPQNVTSVATLISLELSRNFIKNIPMSISKLTNLTILNLQCNRLSVLPESFSKLQHLQLLDLSSNRFTIYPEVINSCLNLLQIDLSSNRIYRLPESINNLTKLAKLNLAFNNLKVIPHLTYMSSLRTINLKDNLIYSFNASSKTLQYVYLNDNKISSFEDELPNLRTLELEKNPLTSVYFKENYMNNLTTLTLSKANLTIVPSIIWKKFIKLKNLDLNENNLTQISEAIGNLTYLTNLSCNRNKLEKIPKNIVNLKNLKVLDLHSNNITDIISGFVNLELTTLNLSSNALGPWQTSLLEEVNENSPLVQSLIFLSLADNRLNNDSYLWLKTFTKLRYLNLSYNFFSDLLPNSFDNMLELYLSGNLLTTVPGDFIVSMKKLRILMLNSNKIHTLPAELSLLKELSVLDCSNNLLKYNISNYLYDYNWLQNEELRYLNFSGNKRFEIADSVINNINYADLTKLPKLLVLSLMDVTLKTSRIPDEDFNLRLRTTESKVNNMAYGVADSLGLRSFVNYRDNSVQRFRGKIDESLLILTDGKNEISNTSNKLPKLLRDMYPTILSRMLEKYGDSSEKCIKDSLRHSFLQLNKELNAAVHDNNNNSIHKGSSGFFHASSTLPADHKLSTVDLSSGATLTVVYIKDKVVYTANIGDTMAVLSSSTGDHRVLTKKHIPGKPQEYVRIRIAGGYVSNGKVDGVSDVSRAVGFFHLMPHIHASPDINVLNLTKTDEMLIIATNNLWNHIDYETASDIARANKQQPMNAAAQIRDLALAYGCEDSICVICISLEAAIDSLEEFTGQFNFNREALSSMRRDNKVFEDTALRRLEPEISAPTGNVSIVFTDIKNSTSLWESFPDAMRSAIKTHNNVMRRNLRLFGGYEVKTEGDAFMVAFPSPLAALNWCLTVQLKLLQASWPEQITNCPDGFLVKDEDNNVLFLGLSVRMGIHWGKPVPEMDVVTQRMDYLGPVVNKASRVSSVADGGQITLSMDFITEFKAILDMNKRFKNKEGTLKEIYGDEFVGEFLEKQLQTLNDIGYYMHDLGETKMKGLETKEFITLIYPEQVKGRLSLIQSASDDLLKSRETLFFLRKMILKLEDLVSYYDCDKSTLFDAREDGKLFNFTTETQQSIFANNNEEDLVNFFDHLICRLECSIVTLNIRQKMFGQLERTDKKLSIFEILDLVTGVKNEPNRNLASRNLNRH